MSTESFIVELFTKYGEFVPDEHKIRLVKDLLEFEKEEEIKYRERLINLICKYMPNLREVLNEK